MIDQSVTVEERAELIRRRPINWDDMGSSAKDLWEARQLRSIRKSAEHVERCHECRTRKGEGHTPYCPLR